MQEVHLKLHQNHCNKVANRQSFQLSHDQLVNGSGDHHVILHMHNKHHKQLEKAHRERKGFRFSPDKVAGGSIRDYFKKAKNALHSVGVTDNMMRSAGNSAVNQAELYANQHGVAPIISHTVADYAHNRINGGRLYDRHEHEHEHEHRHSKGGKLQKGSIEAKEHMKRLREMRKSKGGKINMHLLKSVGKQIIHPIVTYGLTAGATALSGGDPFVGAVAGQVAGHYANNAIDKAIGSGMKRGRKSHGGSFIPIGGVRGGSFNNV